MKKESLPCDEENKVNVDECLLNYFEANNSCVLPWRKMVPNSDLDETYSGKERPSVVCKNSTVFNNLKNFMDTMEFIGEEDLYQECISFRLK